VASRAGFGATVLLFGEMQPRTLFEILLHSAQRFGSRPALHQPIPGKPGERRTYSWNEYAQAAEEVGMGLRQLKIHQGDIVALYSETRAEFYISDFGIFANGSIAAAIYSTYSPEQVLQTLETSEARALLIEDGKALQRVRDAAGKLGKPLTLPCVVMVGEAENALTFEQLRASGREVLASDPQACRRLQDEIDPELPAILYLTSGATGEPKMALVSHRAIRENAAVVPEVLHFLGPEDRTLAFLPSAHMAQRMAVEFVPIPLGMQVFFAESLMKLPQEMREVKPTFFLAPPRLWERIYSTIRTEVSKKGRLSRNIFFAALGLGIGANEYRQRGETLPWWKKAPLALAERVVYRKILNRFGGCMRMAVSGAAPLGKDMADFYNAFGLPLVEGYGLTEGGITILNPLERPKPGSIGKPLPRMEVRISEEGELLIRSRTLFTGYWKDPVATAEVLRDGWLHTGDIASIDEEGYVSITGRKKELIVLSTGKKVYPSHLEVLLKMEPLFNFALLIGDRLPYLTALLTLNPAALDTVKGIEPYRGRPMAEIVESPPLKAEAQKAIRRVNAQVAPWEQIRRYKILDRDFSIDAGELTPTMKIRRARALENFRHYVTEMYAGKEESH
jgi:long-chain acyl-CoA synthetase